MKGMNEIAAVAGGTWSRILRMKVVYVLILCVLALIGSAYRYDVLSLGQHKALMVDVSLLLNTVAAVLIALSITFEISKEFREGVATTLLSKSLGRTQYLIGKLIGISIAGIVITGLIAIGFGLIFSSAFDKIAQPMISRTFTGYDKCHTNVCAGNSFCCSLPGINCRYCDSYCNLVCAFRISFDRSSSCLWRNPS